MARRVAPAVLGLALVFSTTLAVIQWRRAAGLERTERARHGVTATAGAFGVALLSYDYADLSGARGRVLALATPAFAKSYKPPGTSGVDAAILNLKATESAKLASVSVTDVAGGRAGALVVLDTTLRSTAGTRNSVGYLELSLARVGSAWKVDTVRPLTPAA